MARKTNIEVNGKNYYRVTRTVGRKADGTPIRKQFYGTGINEANAKADEYINNIKNGLVNNFENVTHFEVEAVSSLVKLSIGDQSFSADYPTLGFTENDPSFSILNCSSLQSITIGRNSFVGFMQFNIGTLPSLQSIYIGENNMESNNFLYASLKLIGSSKCMHQT